MKKKWGIIYSIVVLIFSFLYYSYWYINPDSFIINSELNLHPLQEMQKFLEGDTWKNTTTTTWREEIREKGTVTSLTEKELFQVTGANVTSTSHPIGRKEEP